MSKPGRSRDVSSPEDYSNRSWSGNRGSHGHGNEDRLERLFALLCQDIAVAVIVMALYPSLCDRAIDPALEVAVTNFKELVTPQDTGNCDVVPSEHRENLPRCVIFCAHDAPVSGTTISD